MIGTSPDSSPQKEKPSKKEGKTKKPEKTQVAAREHSQDRSVHVEDTTNKWDNQKFVWLGVVTLVSFVTKFYGLGSPDEVV